MTRSTSPLPQTVTTQSAREPPFWRRLALYRLGYLRRADLAFLRAGLCRTGDVAGRHWRGLLPATRLQGPLPAVMTGQQ